MPLESLARDLYDAWELKPDGEPRSGTGTFVVPVLTTRGDNAVLKVAAPSAENEHEHLALSRWAGRGAATLLRADPRRRALLLERLQEASLEDSWDVDACEVVGALYGVLHIPAFPQLRLLSEATAATADRLEALPRNAPLPRRLVEQAVSLARDLAADEDTDGTLVHGDLHYGNVLLDEDADWRAISPKPLSGDPHYEPAPMLWNRYDELVGGPESVRDAVRRRFHTLVDVAGLDEDRARDWVVVRMLTSAAECLESRNAVTRAVAVAKAVQD